MSLDNEKIKSLPDEDIELELIKLGDISETPDHPILREFISRRNAKEREASTLACEANLIAKKANIIAIIAAIFAIISFIVSFSSGK